MNSLKETLKPCPYCEDVNINILRATGPTITYRIACDSCWIRTGWYNTPEEAAGVWNRRACDVRVWGSDVCQNCLTGRITLFAKSGWCVECLTR